MSIPIKEIILITHPHTYQLYVKNVKFDDINISVDHLSCSTRLLGGITRSCMETKQTQIDKLPAEFHTVDYSIFYTNTTLTLIFFQKIHTFMEYPQP